MSSSESFDDCLARLRSGDEEAALQIFERFAQRLIGLARSRLDGVMRQKVDPEDVMQSAFKSFFRSADRPYELSSWDSLWSLLARIALRKCGRRIRHFRTAQRDVRREIVAGALAEESGQDWEALGREPSPSEAAVLAETVEALLRSLDERNRHILVLSLQGCEMPEIAKQVGCTERTVYRVLRVVRAELHSRQDEET
jgi:RNA polymerase sigma-70 factor, ECF subfamily